MVKKCFKINVDKLKICYRQPQQIWEYIAEYNNGDVINFDCFYLQILDCGKPNKESKKPSTKITANCVCDDGTLMGTFTFHNSAKYEGLCFFEFANTALYKPFAKNVNYLCCFEYIEQVLNLVKNNITTLEIAVDTNFNPLIKFYKLFKDYNNNDLIVNGKKIEDINEIIQNFGEYFERSIKKRKRFPSVYVKQKKDNTPQLKIYDKKQEMKENNKEYISEWNEFKGNTMYRIEITVKNEDFKQFLLLAEQYIAEWGDLERVLSLLNSDEYKLLLWDYITHRMLYFAPKKRNSEAITMRTLTVDECQPKKTLTHTIATKSI